MSYFVTGLPRSRTAWMSVWLGCKHDGLSGCYSDQDVLSMVGDGGLSDSMLAWFPIRKYYKKAPVLVIHRHADEVVDSLSQIVPIDSNVLTLLADTQERMNMIDGLHVNYDEIDSRLPEIWEYLRPDVPFSPEWTRLMMDMNVTTTKCVGDVESLMYLMEDRNA